MTEPVLTHSKNPQPAGSPGLPAAGFHPLGLPRGSVRALLSLMVLGMVVLDVLRVDPEEGTPARESVQILWSECLVIVLAGYFTSRRFVQLPKDVARRLEEEGVLPVDKPLGLPRFTMRVLLMLTFGALAVQLYRQDRLLDTKSAQILGLALAFLVGAITAPIIGFFTRGKTGSGFQWWENLKAATVLGIVAACMVVNLALGLDHMPVWVSSITIWLVLFYFGSR
ncbi:MAG: hypothetical protein DWH82_02185 [Planctomycetota bacterium]|nr:MAG: hypothetical protein DWH82_02185 [Planctomycetota bacterium]